jgi:hypothetical protein
MSPLWPNTCGTPLPSSENPDRAHVGSGPVSGAFPHPVTAGVGLAAGFVVAGAAAGLSAVQPASSSAATSRIRLPDMAHLQ